MVDNVLGTNDVGEVIGMDQVPRGIWDPTAYEAEAQVQALQLLGALMGAEALGAAPPPRTPSRTPPNTVKKKASKGAGPVKGVPPKAVLQKQTDDKKKVPPHLRGIDNAKGAAKFAKDKGTKAVAKGGAYRASDHKPLAVVTQKGVHGVLGIVHDEVFGVAQKSLSPRQETAVQKHNVAIARNRAAATNLVKAGNRALAASKAASASVKKNQPIIDKFYGKKTSVGVLGFDEAGYAVLGIDETDFAVLGIDETIEYGHVLIGLDGSGYDELGQIDPTQWGLPALQPFLTDLTGDNPDPNLTSLPTGGGVLSKESALAPWTGPVPPAGVKWEFPTPVGGVGSANVFYGNGRGYYYGSSATGVNSHWTRSSDPVGWYLKKNEGDISPSTTDNWENHDGEGWQNYNSKQMNEKSIQDGYGPIVGNNGSRGAYGTTALKGAQYSPADDKYFWTIDNAPPAMLIEPNAALAELNFQIHTADNEAINTENKRILKEATEMAEAKAKKDAANALAKEDVDREIERQKSKDTAAEESATSAATQADIAAQQRLKEAQEKFELQQKESDQRFEEQRKQYELEETTRAAQLEVDMKRAQQAREAQQAQYEQQAAMAQQQYEQQMSTMQQQLQAQIVPQQMQMDAQVQTAMLQELMQPTVAAQQQAQSDAQLQQAMLQMLMQPQPQPQPQQQQFDPQMEQAMLQMLMQQGPQGPQAYPQQPQFDPSQQQYGFDPTQGYPQQSPYGFNPQQQYGFDPTQGYSFDLNQGYPQPDYGFDPTQIPGYFDASAYYGG